MARTGVTYHEVELAAEKILQAGGMPTIERIRMMLGTGSHSTICRYFNEWKHGRMSARAETLPPLHTPPDPVNMAVRHVWQQLQQETDHKLQQLHTETEAKIAEISQLLHHTETHNHQLAKENQSLQQILLEERRQSGHKERQIINLRRELAVISERAANFQTELAKVSEEYEKTTKQFFAAIQEQKQFYEDRVQSEALHYKHVINELKDIAENQRHEHIALIDKLRTENTQLRQQHQKYLLNAENNNSILCKLIEKVQSLEDEKIKLAEIVNKTQDTISCFKLEWKNFELKRNEEITDNITKNVKNIIIKNFNIPSKKVLSE